VYYVANLDDPMEREQAEKLIAVHPADVSIVIPTQERSPLLVNEMKTKDFETLL